MDSLPVIDFAPFLEGAPLAKAKVAQEIYNAACNYGFMYLKNFGLSPQYVEEAFQYSKAFFAQTSEEKNKTAFDPANNFGYAALAKEALDPSKPADLKETFTMRNVMEFAEDDSVWPSDAFREKSISLFSACQNCAQEIMRAFAIALKIEETFFDDKHNGHLQTLRLLNYPPSQNSAPGQLGAGAHTDYGTLTVLLQDNQGGLQVQNVQGEWIDAPPIEGTVVINTGDLTARWSNDIFRSTPHRVKTRASSATTARQSIAFFSDPDPDVLIETISTCITDSNPKKYPPITAKEHIHERIMASQAK